MGFDMFNDDDLDELSPDFPIDEILSALEESRKMQGTMFAPPVFFSPFANMIDPFDLDE